MTGGELRKARLARGWTQTDAAKKFRVTQAYVSMMEHGVRPVPLAMARKLVASGQVNAMSLPLEKVPRLVNDEVRQELASLGYPGFAYLRRKPRYNPAVFLVAAVTTPHLDRRTVEGLPWLACRYADLDWNWAVAQAKLRDAQNRLGFLVQLGCGVAHRLGEERAQSRLSAVRESLAPSRLAREDTLCRESMLETEREWLRGSRPSAAAYWNLLTDLDSEHLHHVEA